MSQDGGWQVLWGILVQYHGQNFALAKLGLADPEERGAATEAWSGVSPVRGAEQYEKQLWDWRGGRRGVPSRWEWAGLRAEGG